MEKKTVRVYTVLVRIPLFKGEEGRERGKLIIHTYITQDFLPFHHFITTTINIYSQLQETYSSMFIRNFQTFISHVNQFVGKKAVSRRKRDDHVTLQKISNAHNNIKSYVATKFLLLNSNFSILKNEPQTFIYFNNNLETTFDVQYYKALKVCIQSHMISLPVKMSHSDFKYFQIIKVVYIFTKSIFLFQYDNNHQD